MHTAMPRSITPHWLAISLTAVLVALLYYATCKNPFGSNATYATAMVIVCFCGAFSIFDLLFIKSYSTVEAGLDSDPKISWRRAATKLVGLLTICAAFVTIYWLFPEYNKPFYKPFFEICDVFIPVWLLLAIPYFILVDAIMTKPKDGYFYLGRFMLGGGISQFSTQEKKEFIQFILSWGVKGFFSPLMIGMMVADVKYFSGITYQDFASFPGNYKIIFRAIFFADVSFASCAYLFTFRIFNTHVRSTESTLFGWIIAMICYPPFWSLFSRQYFNYASDVEWSGAFASMPLLQYSWGCLMVVIMLGYLLSTAYLGIRFSNLTNRGIVTNGPYAVVRHPSYVSKNIFWWLVSVPFLCQAGPMEALRRSILLLCVNGIYALRAWTEERHLGMDPVYSQYKQAMSRRQPKHLFSRDARQDA